MALLDYKEGRSDEWDGADLISGNGSFRIRSDPSPSKQLFAPNATFTDKVKETEMKSNAMTGDSHLGFLENKACTCRYHIYCNTHLSDGTIEL